MCDSKTAVFIVGVKMHAACKSFIVNQDKKHESKGKLATVIQNMNHTATMNSFRFMATTRNSFTDVQPVQFVTEINRNE